MAVTRLTVLYNLAAGVDEEVFLNWRMTVHRKYVESMPGVLRTDFSRINRSWPDGMAPKFRFQTIVDWPDYDSFEKSFLSDSAQEKLKNDNEKIGESLFIVSEILSE